MTLQHINLKLFAALPEAVNADEFIRIFNQWIQEQAVPGELLVDVADYRHVHHGPGVLLIGHEANYSFDYADGRAGLLYSRKAVVGGGPADVLAQAARALLAAAQRLQRDNGIAFGGRELQIIVNDRRLAPNSTDTYNALARELSAFATRLFGATPFTLTHHPDPRERFTVTATAAEELSLDALIHNFEKEPVHA
jgi:hypothetical protein